jgi:alkaline phosphatase
VLKTVRIVGIMPSLFREFCMLNRKFAAALLVTLMACGWVSGEMPKYIIVFIGDGMGPEEVKAAGMYANGQEGTLSFEKMPVKTMVTTSCAGGGITDSAAAATAIATGRKVDKGVLSMAIPGDGKDLETLLEYCQKHDMSTGLVTTSFLTDATPAAFASHADKRADFNDVVRDYLAETRPNVLLGGNKHIKPAEAKRAGYTVVTNRDEFIKADAKSDMLAGLFGTKGVMPYVADPESKKYPSLAEMTATAIRILEKDPDGFFLMSEGGNIDHAGHLNKLKENVSETVGFSEAVAAAMDWAKGKDNVLIIVTADHETGGLTVVKNNGQGKLPEVKWAGLKHTGVPVGLWAWGKEAEKFASVKDNTEIRSAITGEPMPQAATGETQKAGAAGLERK